MQVLGWATNRLHREPLVAASLSPRSAACCHHRLCPPRSCGSESADAALQSEPGNLKYCHTCPSLPPRLAPKVPSTKTTQPASALSTATSSLATCPPAHRPRLVDTGWTLKPAPAPLSTHTTTPCWKMRGTGGCSKQMRAAGEQQVEAACGCAAVQKHAISIHDSTTVRPTRRSPPPQAQARRRAMK